MKYLYILPILIFCSCANNRLVKDVTQFMGTQIILSPDLSAVWKGRDTVLTDFTKVPIKLVVYHDSLICSTCQMGKMYEWEEIAAYADSLSQWFSIIYLFTPKKEDMFKVNMLLRADNFDYPIFIDQHATFVKQNPKLPKNRQLYSFLLDKNNKVVMVGNPLHNPTLWNLYKKNIQKMIENNGILSK